MLTHHSEKLTIGLILALLGFWFSYAPRHASAEEPIKPQFNKCTLTLDGKVLVPTSAADPWVMDYRVGDRRFSVAQDLIAEISAKDGKPIWSLKSEDGKHLKWLAADDGVVLLQGYRPGDEKHEPEFDSPPQIRRLNLVSRKWEPSLMPPVEKKKPEQKDVVAEVKLHRGRVAVLTEQLEPGEFPQRHKRVGYRATFFRGVQEKPAWSRTFLSMGARPTPGVALWAPVMPDYAEAGIRALNWLGDNLLLCAGENEDVICLDGDGKIVWRVSRVWEYQRGFIGPSVWSHYISRFGFEDWEEILGNGGKNSSDADKKARTPEQQKAIDDATKRMTAARETFERQFQCAIVGGPVIANDGEERTADAPIFLAVSKGPNQWNAGYLSDCILYELNAEGRVVGMSNLPRMVDGSKATAVSGGVVWSCQHGAMMRVMPPSDDRSFGMGPGGPDLICNVAWYRQFEPVKIDAWLSAGKSGDVVAFGRTDAFVTVSGGYVKDKSRHIYSFPIAVVNLKTGIDRTATLDVPFDNEMPLPKTNYSGGGGKTEVLGPYLLGVTQLHMHGDALEIVLGMEKSAAVVTFDIGAALPQQ